MQLQSYRKLGFCTHLFTIIKQDNTLHAQIHDVTETDSSLIYDYVVQYEKKGDISLI